MNSGLNHNKKFIGGMCGFGMTWILIMILMIGDLTEYGKRKVEGDIPYLFPVVVRIDNRAQILSGDNLTQYLKEHPDCSFLIPEHQIDMFKGQVESNTRAIRASSSPEYSAFFTVKTIAPGKQTFKVVSTHNEDVMNVGWYEATDKEVFPQHHTTYFGPAMVVKEAPIAFLITLAIWLIVRNLIRPLRRIYQRRYSNGDSIQGQT